MIDWFAWHDLYDDPASPLSRRLMIVQSLLERAVARSSSERLRVLSLCAGDGRDLVPVLARWSKRRTISGRLIELEPRLVERASRSLTRERLHDIEAVCADAAFPSTYMGAIPADLVVACGLFGNVSDTDAKQLVAALPFICAESGSVIWTRHRRQPDLTPSIRAWLVAVGFAERALVSCDADQLAVGWSQMTVAQSEGALPAESLFTFLR